MKESVEPTKTEVEGVAEVEGKAREKKERDEEDIVEERFYTVPLRKAWISPRRKRAPKAMRLLKNFIQKHMKLRIDAEGAEESPKLVIDNEVNEKIWDRGIEKPPRRIRVRVTKDKDDTVTVFLAEGD